MTELPIYEKRARGRAAASVAVLLCLTPAKAAPPEIPAPANQTEATKGNGTLVDSLPAQARVEYEAARMLYEQGDSEGALIKFRAAYESSKDPRLLWNMGVCEKKLRRYGRATTLVRRYLAEGGATLSAADRTEAGDLLAALASLTTDLTIEVNESGAEITVDGERVGGSPLVVPVLTEIGTHVVVGKKPGFIEVRRTITIEGGAAGARVSLVLHREVHEGRLSIVTSAERGVHIAIDGSVVGESRFDGKIRSGGHTVTVEAPEMRRYHAELTLLDGESRTMTVTLEREQGGGLPAWVWWTGGALLAGGLATGGYFLLKPKDEVISAPGGTISPYRIQVP